jgi:hypothetical protein
MATMLAERPTIHEQVLRWQSYFDDNLRDVGVRAPPPIVGQSPEDYVRETCRTLKRQHLAPNDEYYQVDYRGLPNEHLPVYADGLVKRVNTRRKDPMTVPFGELREFEKIDPVTGVKSNVFIGQDNFVRFMGRPGRWGRIWNDRTKEWYGEIPKPGSRPL